MKVITSIAYADKCAYAGYTLFSDSGYEYATNCFKLGLQCQKSSNMYALKMAIYWVQHNKPLYCNKELNYTLDSHIEDFKDEVEKDNFFKQLGYKPIYNKKKEDDVYFYHLRQQIKWFIERDLYLQKQNKGTTTMQEQKNDVALMVFHNGLIGVNYKDQTFIAGKYKNDTVREDALSVANKLQMSKDTLFSVPNRVIRIFTENDINSRVHNSEDIKTYLKVFDFIETYQNQIINNKARRKTMGN